MKNHLIFLLLLCSLLSCKSDSDDITFDTSKEDFIALLELRNNRQNLISAINQNANNYELIYEKDKPITIPASCISSIQENPDDWNTTFIFTDNNQITVKSIGNPVEIDSDNINVDPYGYAPLTAELKFTTPVNCKVNITIKGQDGTASDISNDFNNFGTEHCIPVLGLYPNYNNTVEITFTDNDGNERIQQSVNIETSLDPLEFDIEILKNNLPENDQALFFDTNDALGFDKFGKIRYVNTLASYSANHRDKYLFRKTKNNKLLIAHLKYNLTTIWFFNLLGELEEEIIVPTTLHHDFRVLENGDILCPMKSADGLFDGIAVIDRSSGEIVKQFNLLEIFDPERPHWGVNEGDWLHINCAYIDPADDNLVVSVRHQDLVTKIDYQTQEIIWMLGPNDNWSDEYQPFLFTPTNFDHSEWNWGQHAPLTLPNGNILLFNNGNYRTYDDGAIERTYTNAVEFELNHIDKTVSLVWEYGKDRNLVNTGVGDVDYIESTQNRIIGFSKNSADLSTPLVIELDSDDNVMFEARYGFNEPRYRVEKISLY